MSVTKPIAPEPYIATVSPILIPPLITAWTPIVKGSVEMATSGGAFVFKNMFLGDLDTCSQRTPH